VQSCSTRAGGWRPRCRHCSKSPGRLILVPQNGACNRARLPRRCPSAAAAARGHRGGLRTTAPPAWTSLLPCLTHTGPSRAASPRRRRASPRSASCRCRAAGRQARYTCTGRRRLPWAARLWLWPPVTEEALPRGRRQRLRRGCAQAQLDALTASSQAGRSLPQARSSGRSCDAVQPSAHARRARVLAPGPGHQTAHAGGKKGFRLPATRPCHTAGRDAGWAGGRALTRGFPVVAPQTPIPSTGATCQACATAKQK
jgi:hypothetical protein